jgi:hypothetical protein
MAFEFGYSNPHPTKMGEIYTGEINRVMSGAYPPSNNLVQNFRSN